MIPTLLPISYDYQSKTKKMDNGEDIQESSSKVAIQITPHPDTIDSAYLYAQKNGRIVPWASYGEHIELQCTAHPDKRWSTKNIGSIFERSIFHECQTGLHCGVDNLSCWTCDSKRETAINGTEFQQEDKCGGKLAPYVPHDWIQRIVPIAVCKCDDCGADICEEGRNSRPNTCGTCFERSHPGIFARRQPHPDLRAPGPQHCAATSLPQPTLEHPIRESLLDCILPNGDLDLPRMLIDSCGDAYSTHGIFNSSRSDEKKRRNIVWILTQDVYPTVWPSLSSGGGPTTRTQKRKPVLSEMPGVLSKKGHQVDPGEMEALLKGYFQTKRAPDGVRMFFVSKQFKTVLSIAKKRQNDHYNSAL